MASCAAAPFNQGGHMAVVNSLALESGSTLKVKLGTGTVADIVNVTAMAVRDAQEQK